MNAPRGVTGWLAEFGLTILGQGDEILLIINLPGYLLLLPSAHCVATRAPPCFSNTAM